MDAAAADGSIAEQRVWHPVRAGDFVSIPANTSHAIGAGIAPIEVQRNSDNTYRLYDHGGPRELHPDRGLAIAHGHPHPAALRRRVPETGDAIVVDGPAFRLDRLDGPPDERTLADHAGPPLTVPLTEGIRVGPDPLAPGQCALAQALAACILAPSAP